MDIFLLNVSDCKFLLSTLPNKKSWDDQCMFCTLLSERTEEWYLALQDMSSTVSKQRRRHEALTPCRELQVHLPTSLVICCYWQVYFFNMSCLGVILQVRGRDGMSTPQNGLDAYSQSHISHICQGSFPKASLWFSSS